MTSSKKTRAVLRSDRFRPSLILPARLKGSPSPIDGYLNRLYYEGCWYYLIKGYKIDVGLRSAAELSRAAEGGYTAELGVYAYVPGIYFGIRNRD